MRTLHEAWRLHGVDDDQPAPEFFQYGWEASEEAHAAEIARLTAERDALKLDAERLDWCEKHLVEVGQDMSEQFRVVFLDENERDQRSARFPSLRQAIDAAIATTKEQHD